MKKMKLLFLFLTVLSFSAPSTARSRFGRESDLWDVYEDIWGHKEVADKIIDFVMSGPGQGQVYNRLATMTDKFGYRLCGSSNLEDAIDYMVDEFKKDGLENVHKESVKIPHWTRGKEWAKMISPRPKPLAMLGLGYSVGTPKEGITAQAIVVRSFDELKARATEAKGKIVVFNQIWENYSQSVQYRSRGASETAKVGGVASLIRSATGFSIYSPHTGQQSYEDGVKKVPTACITVEDAELLWRMSQRGENITLSLYMEAQNHPDVTSYNTVAEIKGSLYPEEVVLVSGHLDSWDVGQGAMDDGGGAFISWQALSIARQLGLRPKRTLRVVFWTCEELGIIGGQSYYKKHAHEAKNFDIIMESDKGTFTPQGLQFSGSEEAMKIVKTLARNLLSRVNATVVEKGAELSDVGQWLNLGVPGGSILNENSKYFDFHHSNGDTMTVQDSNAMDLCSAVWAVSSFVIADLDKMLPANRTIASLPFR
ncbi:carboxypeptidase Q [Aplysia californica]|uniref:Carboxypeptidase Q n=1 Tax=Aplysia californica TaxID=6500 RepID=A0ABM1A6I3_APLCA|nr:carboxypeptidase Q [Aplysia californica]